MGFVKECLVVDEDLYVDPEGTDDSVIDDPNLFAQQHEQATGQHCQKFEALYKDVLANVIECLELRASREWPGRSPFHFGQARDRETFLYAAAPRLPDEYG